MQQKKGIRCKSTLNFEQYINERHRIFNVQDANKECLNINWGSLSLGGEVGEFQNLVKKINRDDEGIITNQRLADMQDELETLSTFCVTE